MTHVAVTGLSHVGLVRDNHEDSLVVGPWTLCAAQTETPQTLLFPVGSPLVAAVADGLGGHAGGELASALVVRLLARVGPSLDSEQAIREALADCNRAVYAAAASDPELTGMGTTVAGVVVLPEQVVSFNVGDSRVYLAGPDGLRQLSVDDRPATGALFQHTVTQTLGGHDEPASVDPHLTGSSPSVDTRYLVCTDGLTDVVPTETIARTLEEHRDGRAAFELWKAAMEGGAPDNVTLALIHIRE